MAKSKRTKASGPKPDRGPGNFIVSSHHELWARLAAVRQMHGTPGQRKGKQS